MRAVDLLNPFKRPRPFDWIGPCIVSSMAGLGDLFIHLPLIDGIVNECRSRRLEVRVALRPPLAAIGEMCGWPVIPFDDSLVDLFKTPDKFRASDLVSRVRARRRESVGLWIDLTGNALSALAIKCTGARALAARTTRGGRSMIDHPLPHRLLENEYDNRDRVADYLGCKLEPHVYDRLREDGVPHLDDVVVLSLTSACRWKSWPLTNFAKLVDHFPHVQFALTGFAHEVVAEEEEALSAIRSQPNVVDRLDRLSVVDLVRLIARSAAIVTNDAGAAHIANGFSKPGAVLFGPSSPGAFAMLNGLRIFRDTSCPLHPCVQWRCARANEWCMRKIPASAVISYLATLPSFVRRGATACPLR
jgi:ADP-heptose:LPS heptosyltransferase